MSVTVHTENGYGEWVTVYESCVYCGSLLQSRPSAATGGMVIKGYEPMEYRHLMTGSPTCTKTYKAQPYSDANQRSIYQKALDARPDEVTP